MYKKLFKLQNVIVHTDLLLISNSFNVKNIVLQNKIAILVSESIVAIHVRPRNWRTAVFALKAM